MGRIARLGFWADRVAYPTEMYLQIWDAPIATSANKVTRVKNCVDISLLYFFHAAAKSPSWRKQVVDLQEVEEPSWLTQVDLIRKQNRVLFRCLEPFD